MKTGTAYQLSPIARKQQQMAGFARGRLGGFGLTGSAGGAASGAATGASIGSAVPVIGTAIGAIGGAIGGAIAGAMGKKDQEIYNFDAAVQIWQNNRLGVLNIANKYLPLAGVFDNYKNVGGIPIIHKYGKMGEERFTADFANLIYQAAQSGQITASDTPQSIMVKVVQPWIDSWGFGPMSDPHGDLINLLLMGMIADYVSGNAPNAWRARGGDLPRSFSSIPPFSLPLAGGTTVAPAAQYAAGTAIATAPLTQITAPAGGGTGIPVAPPVPSTVLTADGSSATPSSMRALKSATGQVFYFGPQAPNDPNNPLGSPIWVNGVQNGYGVGLLIYNNGQVYSQNIPGQWVQWTGSGWALSTSPASQAPTVTPVAATTVSIPAGFTLIGSANNLQAYLGPDGNYYTWSGTAMALLTGVLTTSSGQVLNVLNGGIQAPTAPQPISTQQIAPAGGMPAYISVSAPVPAGGTTPNIVPAAAGIGAGLPSWAGIAAIGVLGFMILNASKGHKNPRREHA